MSDPILPFDTWDSGTNQNSIPANDNALRSEILNGDIISDSTDAQPGSPSNGDIYIITGSATGTQWATFDEFDLAIFRAGTWKAFAPVEGIVVNLAGTLKRWNGSAYVDAATGGGGGGAPPVVTESTTNLNATGANAGNYTRFTNSSAKTYTFNDAETFTAGDEYHGRNANTGNLTITPAGTMTINAPAGGTLVVPPSGTFTVKIIAAGAADLIGVTVAA